MNPLIEAAREACDFMSARGWRFCLIGGLAVLRWGEPRTTLDADIALLADWGEEEPVVSALLRSFEPRIPDCRAFALANRVVLLRASNGIELDVVLGAIPFEKEMVRRAMAVEYVAGVTLPCCTAEDLFVMKAFAGRPQDWLDAEGIVYRQHPLDHGYILSHLSDLCESPETLQRARQILMRAP